MKAVRLPAAGREVIVPVFPCATGERGQRVQAVGLLERPRNALLQRTFQFNRLEGLFGGVFDRLDVRSDLLAFVPALGVRKQGPDLPLFSLFPPLPLLTDNSVPPPPVPALFFHVEACTPVQRRPVFPQVEPIIWYLVYWDFLS